MSVVDFITRFEDELDGIQFGNYDIDDEFERFVWEKSEIVDKVKCFFDDGSVRALHIGYFQGNGVLIDVYEEETERIVDIYFFYISSRVWEKWEELKKKLREEAEEEDVVV